MSGAPPGPRAGDRGRRIAANLTAVRARIAAACAAAGRPSQAVTLIAVTKHFPASDVALLAAAGVTDVGENRDQEAAAKARASAGLDLTWHFVGQIQTNKCRSIVSYATVVHSVDRLKLVHALDREARRADRKVRCLVQVDLAGGADPGRGGAHAADVPALADAVAGCGALELGGVMAVAPPRADPAAAFASLAELAGRIRADHPAAAMISAGMSADLEAAIAAGSTHIRVGSALLGDRRPVVG